MTSRSSHPLLTRASRIRSAIAFVSWLLPLGCLSVVLWMFSTFAWDQEPNTSLETSSTASVLSRKSQKSADRNAASSSLRDSIVWTRDWRVGPGNRVHQAPLASTIKPAEPPTSTQRGMVSQWTELELGLRLIGTFVEKDRSLGLAISPLGALTYFREGEVLDANSNKIHIDRIGIETVAVTHLEQKIDWSLGQPLRLSVMLARSSANEQQINSEPQAPSSDPKSRPMDLNRELELLNGSTGEDPLP